MGCEPCVVITTAATREKAEAIGLALLEKRLAACVQYAEIRSHYVWQGEVCLEAEVRVVIKTCRHLYAQVEDCVRRLHDYDCPQFLCFSVQASADYQAWMDSVLQEDGFVS